MIATQTLPTEAVSSDSPPAPAPLTLCVTDVTGQKKMKVRVASGDTETTVGELIDTLLPRMGLPLMADGRPLTYSARLDREGRHLQSGERVAEVLREDDELLLSPSINAG
jgi:hypothetical protein